MADRNVRALLWAEGGAGPQEAFISGHPAKRRRSRWLFEEGARRLGGADQAKED